MIKIKNQIALLSDFQALQDSSKCDDIDLIGFVDS
jgi:hypothetical protein